MFHKYFFTRKVGSQNLESMSCFLERIRSKVYENLLKSLVLRQYHILFVQISLDLILTQDFPHYLSTLMFRVIINKIKRTEPTMNNFIDITYPPEIKQVPSKPQSLPRKKKLSKKNKQSFLPVEGQIALNQRQNYHWNIIEQKRYINFLARHRQIFQLTLNGKKKAKVHVMMSKYIKMRDSIQCRTHHQKMLVKYNSIDNILREFRDLITLQNLPDLMESDSEPVQVKEPEMEVEEKIARYQLEVENKRQQIDEFLDLKTYPYYISQEQLLLYEVIN